MQRLRRLDHTFRPPPPSWGHQPAPFRQSCRRGMRFPNLHGLPRCHFLWRANRRVQLVFGVFLAHGFLSAVRPASGLVLRGRDLLETATGLLGTTGVSCGDGVEERSLYGAAQEGRQVIARRKGRRSRFNRASRRDALDCCGLLEQEARRLNSAAGGIDTSDDVSAKGPGVGIFFRKIDHLAARIRAFPLFSQQHNPGQMPS
jgi:hypothetical protein